MEIPTPYGWWSDYADTSWYNDTSTTFTLTTAAQLAGLAKLVNEGNTFANKTIRLGQDIDLSDHYWWPIGGNRGVSGGVPIGYSFAGTFDGGRVENNKIINYSITGLNIPWNLDDTRPDDNTKVLSGTSYGGFGLFGKASGTIENVTISGSITSNARVIGVGGVVGYTTGNLYNCKSQVTVQCTNTASAQIGGVAGEVYNHAIRLIRHVQYCINTGAVTGGQQVGGIVGEADCYPLGGVVIDNCVNKGVITTVATSGDAEVGGIVGWCEGFLTNSYSIATITSSGGGFVAGLVGELRAQNPEARVNNCYTIPVFKGTTADKFSWLYGTVNSSNTLPIRNVLWCDAANTTSGVSGVTQTIATGNNQQGYWTDTGTATNAAMTAAATGLATVYSSSGTSYTTDTTKTVLNVLGSAFTVSSTMNNGYPVLSWEVNGLTSENENDTYAISSLVSGDTYVDAVRGMVYTIYTADDMNILAGYVNAGKPTEGVVFRLMNDIDLRNTTWAGIGEPVLASAGTNSPYVSSGTGLAGVLDGNGKTITVSRSASTGGIGGVVNYLMPTGAVVDLTVAGSVASTVGSSGNAVGGVVGYNSGSIQNVTNTATVTANSCYNIGGIAGFNNGYYGDDSVGFISECANTATITGFDKVGGITGENSGVIETSYNTGAVNGKDASRSGIGGIAGRNGNNDTAVETGVIRNCYNQGNISSGTTNDGGSWIGGITGFQNAFSTCTNCYNTGTLTGYDYMDNTAGDSDNTASNKGDTNCYGPSESNGAQHYDHTILWTLTAMKTGTALAAALNTDGATIWRQVNGQYPTLVNCGSGSGGADTARYEIVITHQPDKTAYVTGETFDPAGMVIQAVYARYSVTITAYTITPSGALEEGTTYVTISGTYEGKDFSVRQPITVTEPSDTTIILGGSSAGAYQTLTAALEKAKQLNQPIYVDGTVNLTSGTYDGGTDKITILRNPGFHDILFNVPADATVTLKNLVLNGNSDSQEEDDNNTCKNLIRVLTGGTLTVESTVTLDHVNSKASGGAIHVEGGTVTFSGIIQNCTAQNGGGVYVSGGTFTMTGGSITGCTATAVDNDEAGHGGGVCVTNGTFTMTGGTITGCTAMTKGSAIYLGPQIPKDEENGQYSENLPSMVLSPAAGTNIEGTVYLAQTVRNNGLTDATVVRVGQTLSNLTGGLTIECDYPRNGLEVMTGNLPDGTNYQLSDTDKAKVSYVNGYCSMTLVSNQIQLTGSKVVYLNGTATSDGDGTYANPYNNLGSARDDTNAELIIVLGTTNLAAGTYNATKTVRRGESLTDAMFTVSSGTVNLSNLTINGGGTGTIVNVTGGTLTLGGGVTLTNCATAVNVTGGSLNVNRAELNGALYSVYMGSSSGTFTLTPDEATELDGTVYLSSGKYISIGSELTGDIVIESAVTASHTVIAKGVNYDLLWDDLGKLSLVGGQGLSLDENKIIIE